MAPPAFAANGISEMNANGRPMISSAAGYTPGRASPSAPPKRRSRMGRAKSRDELKSLNRSLPLRPNSESGTVARTRGVTGAAVLAAGATGGSRSCAATVPGTTTATASEQLTNVRRDSAREFNWCIDFLPGNQTGGVERRLTALRAGSSSRRALNKEPPHTAEEQLTWLIL